MSFIVVGGCILAGMVKIQIYFSFRQNKLKIDVKKELFSLKSEKIAVFKRKLALF